MTDKGAILRVIDNTGAERVNLFNIPGKKTHNVAVGDKVKVSVVKAIPNCVKAPCGSVHTALVVSTAKFDKVNNMKFSHTAVVLLNKVEKGKDLSMLGTRLNGPISSALQLNPAFKAIVSKAEGVY